MRKFIKFQNFLKKFLILCVFLFSLIYQNNSNVVLSFNLENNLNQNVVEELRLKVPVNFKEAWLKAEKNVWEPWLSKQEGFIGRQIFWNKEKEEALILVNWKNEKLWKSISMKEVNKIQEKFEENVKTSLDLNDNPFKLIYEGELLKQG